MGDSTKQLQFDKEATCEACGRYGAYLFEGKTLCADCYETSGSCCPEFGRENGEAASVEPIEGPDYSKS